MARMSIDDSALRDPRMLRLAKRLGWSRRETIGALMDVWAVCYDRVSPIVTSEDIDAAADHDGFAALMIGVDLAKERPDGIWVRGTDKRIRYLEDQAERGRGGGLKRAENARARKVADETQAYASSGASRAAQAPFNPLPSVPDAVPDPKKLSPAGARDPVPPPATPIPAESFSFDRHRQITLEAWRHHVERFAACQAEGVEPNARAPNALPAGDAEVQLSHRVNDLRAAGKGYDQVAIALRHRVAVAEAESRREGHLRWFKSSRLWDRKQFEIALEMTVEEAGKPRRAPARASPGGALGPSTPHPDHPVSDRLEAFT